MFFRCLHNIKRCFSCPGSGQGVVMQATLQEQSSGLSQAQMYLPRVASTVWEAHRSPLVLTEATGS